MVQFHVMQGIDAKIQQWSNGKKGNIRSLLSTLQYVSMDMVLRILLEASSTPLLACSFFPLLFLPATFVVIMRKTKQKNSNFF